ncbi:MAG: hypothetical protein GXP55_16955 [Deltaproteobacteria bacterium]|nr:hypothetical protein [Deltaproteobacteria bacterium]
MSAGPSGAFTMAFGSVDGHTLLIWGVALEASETSDVRYAAQWFDRDFVAESDLMTIGTGRPAHRSRLIAYAHALYGQFYIDPSASVPPLQALDAAGIWRFAPGEAAEPTLVDLPLSRDRYRPDWDLPAPSLSYAEISAGSQGELPIVELADEIIAGVTAIPASCGGSYANLYRNLLFTERSQFFLWGDDPCLVLPNDLVATNIQLVPVAGEVGVLFRLGNPGDDPVTLRPVGGHVTYMRVNADLELTVPPIMVGNPNWGHPSVDSGYQPKAAVVAGDRILWNERRDAFNFSGNMCQRMHLMDADGTHVHDTPWQLPCDGNRRRYFTSSSDLRSLPSGDAVIAWGERNAYGMLDAWNTRVTSSTPWTEGIYLTMITPGGRRGSPVVTVTPPESTRLGNAPRTADDGPNPGDYLVQMAVDGDQVVIAWVDQRPDAPGVWARHFRCHRNGE